MHCVWERVCLLCVEWRVKRNFFFRFFKWKTFSSFRYQTEKLYSLRSSSFFSLFFLVYVQREREKAAQFRWRFCERESLVVCTESKSNNLPPNETNLHLNAWAELCVYVCFASSFVEAVGRTQSLLPLFVWSEAKPSQASVFFTFRSQTFLV